MSYGQYSDRSAGRNNPLRHDAKVSRRQVFPTSEIPHLWAHQTQESARNPQGNLYFRGPTIYSYRDSWPLARIYTRKDRGRAADATLVLTNCERYSATTAQQQHGVNRAVSHLRCMAVPFPAPRFEGSKIETAAHKENLAYFEKAMQRALQKAERTTTEHNVNTYAERAARLHRDMADYMSFFGIRRKMPALLSFAAAFERARRIENPDPASLDKRERERAKRQERNRERDEYLAAHYDNLMRGALYRIGAQRSDWRLFGAFGTQSARYPHHKTACMLRVNGDEIETSQGACVPVAAAPMVWGLVQRAMDDGGRVYLKALHRVTIGDYPLDRIDADGTLHAGCHVIPFSELASIARQLVLS